MTPDEWCWLYFAPPSCIWKRFVHGSFAKVTAARGAKVEMREGPTKAQVELLMAILHAPAFITASARDCRWLEAGLTLLLKERRANGQRDHPPRLLLLKSELHALAVPAAPSERNRMQSELVTTGGRFGSLSVNESAKRLDVSGAMVRGRCGDESLVSVKVGGRWRIHPESVEQLEAK
jgi:hypothetical protein